MFELCGTQTSENDHQDLNRSYLLGSIVDTAIIQKSKKWNIQNLAFSWVWNLKIEISRRPKNEVNYAISRIASRRDRNKLDFTTFVSANEAFLICTSLLNSGCIWRNNVLIHESPTKIGLNTVSTQGIIRLYIEIPRMRKRSR